MSCLANFTFQMSGSRREGGQRLEQSSSHELTFGVEVGPVIQIRTKGEPRFESWNRLLTYKAAYCRV